MKSRPQTPNPTPGSAGRRAPKSVIMRRSQPRASAPLLAEPQILERRDR